VICVLLGLAACNAAIQLAAPPNVYVRADNYPSARIPDALRNITPQIFYITDRGAQQEGGALVGYGKERSAQMAFGAAQVQFGAADWDDLVVRTSVEGSRRQSRLDITGLDEMVRFSATPLPDRRETGGLRVEAKAAQDYAARTRAFQQAIREEIKRTGNDQVLIFTHGAFTEFDDAIVTLANLWHYIGRDSIPIAFSWPAGNRGPLGYFRDRAAGDFSVYHAKETLRMLAEMPEVAQIDIVAHSRGTDIMSQALREAVIFQRGRGVAPKLGMKTGTLILAAADLDTGIMQQRLLTERTSEAFEQVNVYVNPNDFALRLSSLLTNSGRVGALQADDLDAGDIGRLRKQALIHFIQVEDAQGSDSHSYFRGNPAVLSDIVLALRTRAFPGGTLRPLEEGEDGIWLLHPNYPLERLPDLDLEAELLR
jgi:esterase/lipase superfamily enzyme